MYIIDLPFNIKKTYNIYIESSFEDILFLYNKKYYVPSRILTQLNIKNKTDLINKLISHDVKQIKQYQQWNRPTILDQIHNNKFTIINTQYKFYNINNSQDIFEWSLFLNNCLDSYLKGKKLKVECVRTKKRYNIKYSFLLKKNLINLIAVYKNNKPYALIELVDKSMKVKQFLKNKNKSLNILDQHNLLTKLEKSINKPINWVESKKEEVYNEKNLSIININNS